MKTCKYWPLDPDPEGEIYENPAWDLPGFSRERKAHPKKKKMARSHLAKATR